MVHSIRTMTGNRWLKMCTWGSQAQPLFRGQNTRGRGQCSQNPYQGQYQSNSYQGNNYQGNCGLYHNPHRN